MAVQSYSKLDKSIIDLLIEKGCDVTCQDKVTCLSSILNIREFVSVNFRTEKHLMSWLMVKGELSFDNITYVIILI